MNRNNIMSVICEKSRINCLIRSYDKTADEMNDKSTTIRIRQTGDIPVGRYEKTVLSLSCCTHDRLCSTVSRWSRMIVHRSHVTVRYYTINIFLLSIRYVDDQVVQQKEDTKRMRIILFLKSHTYRFHTPSPTFQST